MVSPQINLNMISHNTNKLTLQLTWRSFQFTFDMPTHHNNHNANKIKNPKI